MESENMANRNHTVDQTNAKNMNETKKHAEKTNNGYTNRKTDSQSEAERQTNKLAIT